MCEIDVVIEIPRGSNVKYKFDKERHIIVCDKILRAPMNYPFNCGFVLDTLNDSNNPLEAIVLMEEQLMPGTLIRCEILGYLDVSEDGLSNPKLITKPISQIDNLLENVIDINMDPTDVINKSMLSKIMYFFTHYKDLDGKRACVKDYHNKYDAEKLYYNSLNKSQPVCNQKCENKITNYFARI